MSTILEEYFNSYADGDLNGQGSWSGDASFDIGATGAKEGRKGVQNADTAGSNKDIAKTGTQRNDGRIAFYLKRTNTTGQTLLVLNEGADERAAVGLYSDGHIKYKDSGGSYVNLGTDKTYSADTWYLIEVEWRSSDHKIRIFVDGVLKQDWVAPYSNWTSYLDKVVLRVNQSAGTSYWDYISEFGTSVDTSNWGYAKHYKIDHTKIDEDQTNFQVLVKIDNTKPNYQHFFDNAGTDGVSVRFTSELGTSKALLKFEKLRFDATNKKAEYFVKIPSVSSTTDTYFYLLYGRTGALDGSDKTEVYGDEFKAVYHMKDDPDTSHIKDSTINANNGTKKGVGEPVEADGQVEKAQSFDGTDDCVNCGNNASLNITDAITISALIKTPQPTKSYQMIATRSDGTEYGQYEFAFYATTGKLGFGSRIGGQHAWYNANTVLSADTWYYVGVTFNGTNIIFYLNGVSDGSISKSGTMNSLNVNNYIGKRDDGVNTYCFKGIIDEVQISNTAKSAARIKADYNSLFDTLITEVQQPALGAFLMMQMIQ